MWGFFVRNKKKISRLSSVPIIIWSSGLGGLKTIWNYYMQGSHKPLKVLENDLGPGKLLEF